MADRDVRETGSVKGVEHGNGLNIDHDRGWQSKYYHMRKGSLLTTKGMPVRAGQPLGLMACQD